MDASTDALEIIAPVNEPDVHLDANGKQLCTHAVWGRRCRWGKACSFSHDVPEAIATAYRPKAEVQTKQVDSNWRAKLRDVEVPAWLREIKGAPSTFRYDTARWPLREAVKDLFGVSTDGQLADLHTCTPSGKPPLCPASLQAFSRAKGIDALPTAWQDALKQDKSHRAEFMKSDAHKRFLTLYRDFCSHVIVPLVGTNAAYVQEPPTLRVHLAGQDRAQGLIGMHKDSDYPYHCPAEVNFWVPLTTVSGTNSLYVESGEGRGDFQPLQLEYGEVYRFNGYDCRHHTERNDSGDSRVSFDLRVVPEPCCPAPAIELRGGSQKGKLRLGDYPAVLVETRGDHDAK